MKLFTPRQETPPIDRTVDVQARPARFATADGATAGQVKVDAAYRVGRHVLVAGWRTGAAELDLFAGGQRLEARPIRVARGDVAAHLGLGDGADLGFVLVAPAEGHDTFALGWKTPGAAFEIASPLRLRPASEFSPGDHGAVGPALGLFATAQPAFSPAWREAVARVPAATQACREVAAFLEGAYACKQTGEAVVVGWVVHAPGTSVWLEDEDGTIHPFDDGVYRRFRQDVLDAVGHDFGQIENRDAGFVARTPGLKPGGRIRLKALSAAGVHTVSETTAGNLPTEPVAAARSLFSMFVPIADFHQRITRIDEQVIGPILRHSQDRWPELTVKVRRLGTAPAAPRTSVIVPLYGRADFVEHQLIELAGDEGFRRDAELIYVIDDPKLVEPFAAQAEALHRLYRVPFTWVWGSANRGFSGANNLGVAQARGEHLIFLNSDAFPQRAGWAGALVEVLREHPSIGAVGPRLTFAEGGIQHAGMAFMRREELGIWVNHHPRMGMDPALDPARGLTVVPAITGACLAMRRSDFDAVGGWDTGYLIGDFEDSDLCLKLRARGLQCAYLPEVQLTHLERQSFKLLGQDEFRTRVVIYNAVRHQNRWGALIEASERLAEAGTAPVADARRD